MSAETNSRDSLKLFGIAVLLSVLICVVLAAAFFLIVFPHKSPPNEQQVIQNFNAHRADFERLHSMLVEDKNLIRLAKWGVQTSKAMGTSENPTADFPTERYHQYWTFSSKPEDSEQNATRLTRLPTFAFGSSRRDGRAIRGTWIFVGKRKRRQTKSQASMIFIECRSPGSRFSGASKPIGICGPTGDYG